MNIIFLQYAGCSKAGIIHCHRPGKFSTKVLLKTRNISTIRDINRKTKINTIIRETRVKEVIRKTIIKPRDFSTEVN